MAISDLDLIGTGAYSPLTGFLREKDYESVLRNMRLSTGVVWTIPITLPITVERAKKIKIGDEVNLGTDGVMYGVLNVEDRYKRDKEKADALVIGSTARAHPG